MGVYALASTCTMFRKKFTFAISSDEFLLA